MHKQCLGAFCSCKITYVSMIYSCYVEEGAQTFFENEGGGDYVDGVVYLSSYFQLFLDSPSNAPKVVRKQTILEETFSSR